MSNREFLSAIAFLETEMDARAIWSAMELGILEDLAAGTPMSPATLAARHHISTVGLRLLLDMLEVNRIIARHDDTVALTPDFQMAWRFRDLLTSRIEFADAVWSDIHTLFTPLLADLPQFMARSKVFDLFRYDRCFEVTPENLETTGRWTKFTTCLTKYEAGAALDLMDLRGIASVVDMGGNTGEFAIQICRRNPKIAATVVDLPVVCELGRRHLSTIADPAEARRISFFPTDMRSGPLPPAADLVAFKSVLHDWPDDDARLFLKRAQAVVRPGGTLLIFERTPIEARGRRISYAATPFLAFLHFLRPADLYVETLADLGFEAIERRRLDLDTEFHFITARRPAPTPLR
jgi:SAM-dependent methyltransferase